MKNEAMSEIPRPPSTAKSKKYHPKIGKRETPGGMLGVFLFC